MTRRGTVVALTERRDQVASAAVAAFEEARLTVAEAATEAKVSEHTIRRAYVHGHLHIQRFGIGQRVVAHQTERSDAVARGGREYRAAARNSLDEKKVRVRRTRIIAASTPGSARSCIRRCGGS